MKPLLPACLTVVMLTLSVPAAAQSYPGTPAKTGQASVTYGGKNLAFATVEGGFQSVQGGFTIATLVFRQGPKAGRTRLNLTLMFQGPGKVDLDGAYSMSGIGLFIDGDVASFTKGKGKCSITLTKASATEVEGTAACPALHNISGEPMPPITAAAFSASVK